MKILITDPVYKHAIALARYLKEYDPSLEIVGVSAHRPRFPSLFSKHYDGMLFGKLEEIAASTPHDLLIPVGNASVEVASAYGLSTAELPSRESIQIGLDKTKTLALAEKLGIPIPKTYLLQSPEDLDKYEIGYPCVVKGAKEAGKNIVSYPATAEEARRRIIEAMGDKSQQGCMPVVQEYVEGTGLGFFGFYQHGELKRFYMHQRLREYPVSGGASTAAMTVYHQEAFDYGKKLLDALKWHGAAMVEFKYNPKTGRLALMEINPKFWGSTELGLAAGLNFGELLVRLKRGEEIAADRSPDSYRRIKFFWPFEGDIAALLAGKRWRGFADYLKGDCKTNIRTNGFLLNCFRLLELMKR